MAALQKINASQAIYQNFENAKRLKDNFINSKALSYSPRVQTMTVDEVFGSHDVKFRQALIGYVAKKLLLLPNNSSSLALKTVLIALLEISPTLFPDIGDEKGKYIDQLKDQISTVKEIKNPRSFLRILSRIIPSDDHKSSFIKMVCSRVSSFPKCIKDILFEASRDLNLIPKIPAYNEVEAYIVILVSPDLTLKVVYKRRIFRVTFADDVAKR